MEKTAKRQWRTAAIVAAALVVLAIGGAIAFVLATAQPLASSAAEGSVAVTAQRADDGTITVTNASSVPAHIRAQVVPAWQDTDGNVLGTTPVENTDYTLTAESGWTELDGAYYYDGIAAAGATVTLGTCVSLDTDAPTEGYDLSVAVLAQAIQAAGAANGKTAVKDAWGYSWDGTAWS